MRLRQLPHFAHSPIGKTTHKKGFSYQHVNYITRDDACTKTLSGNMPDSREHGARVYFEQQANKDGVPANARIADTFIMALPIELTREQRWEAIEGFMAKIGQGRIAWIGAFHDAGEDEHNPHCHLILRDADIETGRKVVGTTTSAKDVKEAKEHGWKVPPRMTTKDLRETWCDHLNAEMERHNIDVRFDHRTLKQQGIDRKAEIHVGPQAHAMAEKGKSFESQDRKRGDHANIYTLLDQASRYEHNEKIKQDNRQAKHRNPNGQEGFEKQQLRERQAQERKALYADQTRDRAALRAAQDAKKLEHQRWTRTLYASARQKAFDDTKKVFDERWKETRQIRDRKLRDQTADALKAEQKKTFAVAATQQIEHVRPTKNETWQTLKANQEQERQNLKQRHTEEVAALSRQHIAERLALHEHWREHHAIKTANQTAAKLQTHQDMATVQTVAVKMIKTNARINGANAVPVTPVEAAKFYSERASAEAANRTNIRYELNASRAANQIRAATRANRRTAPGQIRDQRQNNRETLASQAAKRSREETSKQNNIRHAISAGQNVTDADRTNASADTRTALSSNEKSTKERREERFLRQIEQGQFHQKGRGRKGR